MSTTVTKCIDNTVLSILYSNVGFYFAFVRHCLTFTSITTQNEL